MQLPVINLNGTTPSELLEQYVEVILHLRRAVAALGRAYPNGRDYQTAPPEALRAALDEHANRLLRLRQVLVEIDTLAEHVA